MEIIFKNISQTKMPLKMKKMVYRTIYQEQFIYQSGQKHFIQYQNFKKIVNVRDMK